METYPNNIGKYREAHGLTINQVAQLMEIEDPQIILDFESGKRLPTVPEFFMLLAIFNVSAEELYGPYIEILKKEMEPLIAEENKRRDPTNQITL